MSRTSVLVRVESARARKKNLTPSRADHVVTRREGMRYEVNGQWLVNFASNDYLGICQQFVPIAALQDCASRSGIGGVGSSVTTGYHKEHAALEHEVADWLGTEKALLFANSYLANIAVCQSLLNEDDVCIQDALNNTSLYDAAAIAGCRVRRYPHADAESAMRQLKGVPHDTTMLMTDGVFALDGDIAPVRGLALVANLQHALFFVDDSHAIGVVGPEGRGTAAAARIESNVALQTISLSNALGSSGALVAGNADIIEHIAQHSRSYIFSPALPPAVADVGLVSVRLVRKEHWRREKLFALIAQFRRLSAQYGLDILSSDTAIQIMMCESDMQAVVFARALEALGLWVTPVCSPLVPEGEARLRITLTTLHTQQDIENLAQALAKIRDANKL